MIFVALIYIALGLFFIVKFITNCMLPTQTDIKYLTLRKRGMFWQIYKARGYQYWYGLSFTRRGLVLRYKFNIWFVSTMKKLLHSGEEHSLEELLGANDEGS